MIARGRRARVFSRGAGRATLRMMAGPMRAWAIANVPDHEWML